jgi:hypothetical protein
MRSQNTSRLGGWTMQAVQEAGGQLELDNEHALEVPKDVDIAAVSSPQRRIVPPRLWRKREASSTGCVLAT